MSKGKEIGDPLENARMGKIGGRRTSETRDQVPVDAPKPRTVESFPELAQLEPVRQTQSSSPVPAVETYVAEEPQPTAREAASKRSTKRSKGEREQQTVYLPPDLALWLKVYAVSHKQEISEVVEQALHAFKSSHA